jgi:hypothetical protein
MVIIIKLIGIECGDETDKSHNHLSGQNELC